MRFVETPIFTRIITRLLDDENYRRLQIALMLRPEQGPIIRGAGGLRKVRWAKAGSGKPGHLLLGPDGERLLHAVRYSKNEQDDLTPTQARLLGRLVREEFK